MKKFVYGAAVLTLALSLAACTPAEVTEQTEEITSPVLEAIRSAEALELEGMHQEAMAVLNQLLESEMNLIDSEPAPVPAADPQSPPPETETQALAPAAEDQAESPAAPASQADNGILHGIWKSLNGQDLWEFSPDGTLHISKVSPTDQVIRETQSCPYIYDGSRVEILGVLYTVAPNADGALLITSPDGAVSFAREQDFQKAVVDISLTRENWQDYFELRQAADVTVDSSGKITELRPGYGLFLKEEYVNRYIDGNAVFTCTYERMDMNYRWTIGTDDYNLEKIGPHLWDDGPHYECRPADQRPMELPEDSDYQGTVSVPVGYGVLTEDHGQTTFPEKIEILSVTGSIRLAK